MQNQSFKMTVGDEMFLIWQMFIKKKKMPRRKKVCWRYVKIWTQTTHEQIAPIYVCFILKTAENPVLIINAWCIEQKYMYFRMANYYRQVDLEFQGSFPLVATMGTTCKSSTLMPSRDRSINYQAISSYLMMTELNVLLKKLGHFQFI